MKRISLAVLLTCFLLVAGLAAAGNKPILGKWACVATTPDGGEMNLVLTVKEQNGKLSGAISEPDGEFELIDPKFEKDVFTFRVLLGSGSYDVEMKVAGARLDGTWKGGGQAGEVHRKKSI